MTTGAKSDPRYGCAADRRLHPIDHHRLSSYRQPSRPLSVLIIMSPSRRSDRSDVGVLLRLPPWKLASDRVRFAVTSVRHLCNRRGLSATCTVRQSAGGAIRSEPATGVNAYPVLRAKAPQKQHRSAPQSLLVTDEAFVSSHRCRQTR